MTQDEKWKIAYNLLIKYYKEHGDIYVPRDYIVDGVKLGKWFNHQREFYNKGKLSQERITKLNELSPNWHDTKHKKQSFDFYYNMLKKYYEKYGNIDVPANYVIDDVNLGMWLSRIRHSYKISNGQSLNQEEIDKLNELGINWMIVNSYPFEYYYSLLKEYRNKYGDVNVPYTYEIKGIKLGYWLSNQREAYKDYLKKVHTVSMIITQEEIDKLNELGIIWSFYHMDWTTNYKYTLRCK